MEVSGEGTSVVVAFVRRIWVAFALLMFVALGGTLGFYFIGEGRWTAWDCFYFTAIALSTVGFGETLAGMDVVPHARAFTVVLLIFGSGTLVYFVSTLTAFIVEGDMFGVLRRNRMLKRLADLNDHVIVCGVGATGIHVVEELIATMTPFVAVERDPARIEKLKEEIPKAVDITYLIGDATDDHVLEQAGVARARGVIATLPDDRDNLFITVTARALNGKLRIIAKSVEPSTDAKMRRAGADTVVSPNRIGGMRMVSEMVRPRVVEFLDLMLRDKEKNLRIEEVQIPDTSSVIGAELRDTDIRKQTKVLVIAVRKPDGGFIYNPGPATFIEKGMTLILLAETVDIVKLRQGMADGSIGRSAS